MHRLATHRVLQIGMLLLLALMLYRVEAAEASWHAAPPELMKLSQADIPLANWSDKVSLPHPPQASADVAGDVLDNKDDRELSSDRAEDTAPYYALFNQNTTKATDFHKLTWGAIEHHPVVPNPIFLLTRRIRQ